MVWFCVVVEDKKVGRKDSKLKSFLQDVHEDGD